MCNMINPFKPWTAVLCVVISLMWLSQESAADPFGIGLNAFNMEFVTIGNPGNAGDTTGNRNPAGSVTYEYQIGKFEVSRDMITKYNANFGTANSLAITLDPMGFVTGGTRDAMPATGVSWNEAARFVNWLNTSTSGFAAYKFTTGGVNANLTPWTAAEIDDYDANNRYRSRRANYVLPSMDEWYKAAYYNPLTSTYSDFPNGLDTVPTAVASGTGDNTAVYGQSTAQGPADIMSAGGLSAYGVMGLGGNVVEWEESFEFFLVDNSGSSTRGLRGGFWLFNSSGLSSSTRSSNDPTLESGSLGFRVASLSSAVPEPSSLTLTMFATVCGLLRRQRRRK